MSVKNNFQKMQFTEVLEGCGASTIFIISLELEIKTFLKQLAA